VARSWPRKRGTSGTPAQLAARADFQNIISWVGEPMPQDIEAAQWIIENTLYLPRDVMEMAAYGTIMEARMADGRILRGIRLVATDIQALLDTITQTPGTMLVRTGVGWVALPPGATDQVLFGNGAGNAPSFKTLASVPAALPPTVSKTIYSAPTSVTNGAVTTEVTLQSFTLPGGTLANNGDAIRMSVGGFVADSTHTRTIRIYFGATLIGSIALAAHNENNWLTVVPIIINRLGATSQRCTGQLTASGTGGTVSTNIINTAAAETLANDVLIKITGQSALGGVDITCNQLVVELLP